MEQNALSAKAKISLNVGGKHFATSRTTLLSYKNSYFYTMLSSGKWQPDEDGEYFIDRNPKYFEIILDWMRNNRCLTSGVMELSKNKKEMLKKEAEFYLLDELVRDLEDPGKHINNCNTPNNHNNHNNNGNSENGDQTCKDIYDIYDIYLEIY